MTKEINALELRKHFGEIMEQVRYQKEPYIVKRNGRPMIVLLDIEAYQMSKEQQKEEAFIEEYTNERIAEFLNEDRLNRTTSQQIHRWLVQ